MRRGLFHDLFSESLFVISGYFEKVKVLCQKIIPTKKVEGSFCFNSK